MDNNAVQQCINTTTAADDSDNDEVTDFLNSNCSPETISSTEPINAIQISHNNLEISATTATHESNLNNLNCLSSVESQNYCIPIINTPPSSNQQQISARHSLTLASNNNNHSNLIATSSTKNDNNMIPIINVTPHSPANVSKYNNIFEDTLSQLQNIRESVVQMKNSSASHMNDSLSSYGLVNATILSASLPDLSATGNGVAGSSAAGPYGPLAAHFVMWSPQQQQQYLLNADRRKSWTGIDDLTAGGDTNKSVSLSSLDSEEQETIRVTEQRRRSARNSTGGK